MKKKEPFKITLSFVVLLAGMLLLAPLKLCAQRHTAVVDTTVTHLIPEVVIATPLRTRQVRAAAPTQIITSKQLKSLNALQLSDAVKHFAGVTIKDYGGIGGLKTVSLRSLGAEHTAVGYDGVTLTNTQTGQIDIGRFSLENVDRLTLNNGQGDNIFQPARFFASAGILNIETLTPRFEQGKRTNLSVSLKSGSWGLINPAVLVEQKLSRRWALSANAEWMSADGQYPYTLHYGAAGDSTSQEKRKNTDVKTLRAEVGLLGQFSETEQLRFKTYYYQSSRGLPGATTLYYDKTSEHLWDKNVFSQLRYKKELSRRWALQTSAKWSWSYQRYLDQDQKSLVGKTDNSYYQQEYYLSAALLYRASAHVSLAASTDGSINSLHTNIAGFAHPTRYSWLTALSGKYVNEWLTTSASVLATVINEETRRGTSAGNHRKLTPYITAALKPFADEELRIRFFYKSIFRLPNFNDLYYTEVGNTGLQPENTNQYNLGITYAGEDVCDLLPYLSVTIDAYYNKVTDKIMAIPTKNLFVWSMVNLGQVDIKGIDAAAHLSLQPCKDLRVNLSANHTYQRALDMTDPAGKTYKHQIAYTPRVSGSAQAAIETPWVNFSYSILYSGKRYALGQNLEENLLRSYTDHSISVSKELKTNKMKAHLMLEALNILNKNYEIVRYFPMPGRSVRATLKISF